MTEKDVESMVICAIDQFCTDEGIDASCKNFEEHGILSTDKGIILNLGNKQYQLTIVRSK